jgi:hypothetical protein
MNREDSFSLSRSWKPFIQTSKERKKVPSEDDLLSLFILSSSTLGLFRTSRTLMCLPLIPLVTLKWALPSNTSYWPGWDSPLSSSSSKGDYFTPTSCWPRQDSTPTCFPCPVSMSASKPNSLHPEDGGHMILQNVGILPYHYTSS